MASISPTSVQCSAEPHTSKKAYIKLIITGISQTGGATNQTTVSWKLTVEGTPWVTLYGYYASLGGVEIVPLNTGGVSNWSAGQTLKSGSLTFTNNTDGTLTLYAYIKQLFYYGYSATRWGTVPGTAQEAGVNMVCSQIPRYASITGFSVAKRDETSVTVSYSTDVAVSNVEYSKDNGSNWSSLPSNKIITGLSANTSYNFKLRVTRSDSGLKTTSGTYAQTTYDYPYCNSTPDFTLGNTLTLGLYNPLGRSVTVKVFNTAGTQCSSDTTSSTSISGYTGSTFINNMYAGIPSAKNGTYSVSVTYGSSVKTRANGNKYYCNENDCKPTFSNSNLLNVKDTLHTAITGDATKIISGHNTVTGSISKMTMNKSASTTGAYYSISSTGLATQTKDYLSSNINFSLSNVTSSTLVVTAVDGRGYSNTANYPLTIIPYSVPTFENKKGVRQDGVGVYVTITASGKYKVLTGCTNLNSIKRVRYRKKEVGGSYGSWTVITSSLTTNTGGNWSLSKLLDDTFTNTKNYIIEVEIKDQLDEIVTNEIEVSTANAILWRDLANKRIGINKKPTEALDVLGNAKVSGTINGHTLNNVCELSYTVVDTW